MTVTQTTCDMGGTRRPLLMTRADGRLGVGWWLGEDHDLKSVLSLHSRVLFPKTSIFKRLVRHGMDCDSKACHKMYILIAAYFCFDFDISSPLPPPLKKGVGGGMFYKRDWALCLYYIVI